MTTPAPVHYLRPNESEWTPPSVIFADTETQVLPDVTPETLALRCWVGHHFDRRRPRKGTVRDEWGHGFTATQFAVWIDTVTRGRDCVWLYCHNLAFDLATTRLPLQLTKQGWSITDASIGGKAPWLRMIKGGRRLCLVDSWSWLPTALDEVGAAVGLDKPPLPAEVAGMDEWLARCHADVAILEAAVLALMDWWDQRKLGHWTITGASCGWNAYRHTPSPQRVVIDPDPDLVKRDRRAVYGGRRHTGRVGAQAAGPFYELDLVAAHPTVAKHLPLPVQRRRAFERLDLDDPLVTGDRWSVLAEAEIETDTARWPMSIAGKVWYPVGRFVTTLAGPDLAAAKRAGVLRRIGAGHVHQLGANMAPWATWLLAVQHGEDKSAPPVARLACKNWGRAVIGKWSARSFDKVALGPAPTDSWGYEPGIDHATGQRGGMVDIAGQRWWVAASGEPDNAYPAVLAWVEAYERVRLGAVIDAVGPNAVVQADTDGLIVAGRSVGTRAAGGQLVAPAGLSGVARLGWVLDQLAPLVAPLVLRVKRKMAHVHVIGPQHLIRDGQRRFSGMPGDAEQVGPARYTAKLWPNLSWQLEHGSPAGYVRPTKSLTVVGPYPSGWVLADGRVVPVECELDRAGATRILPWERTRWRAAGLHRADVQHDALDDLW